MDFEFDWKNLPFISFTESITVCVCVTMYLLNGFLLLFCYLYVFSFSLFFSHHLLQSNSIQSNYFNSSFPWKGLDLVSWLLLVFFFSNVLKEWTKRQRKTKIQNIQIAYFAKYLQWNSPYTVFISLFVCNFVVNILFIFIFLLLLLVARFFLFLFDFCCCCISK